MAHADRSIQERNLKALALQEQGCKVETGLQSS
jgi:hypothetical protein